LENINIYKSSFEVRIQKEKIKEIFAKFQTKRLNNNLWKIDNFNKKISNEFNSDQFIKITKLIESLEELDDVQAVYANFDIEEKELESLLSE